jgi:predicted nucleic acid-binding protein
MMRFVLDASVALGWLIDNPTPSYATRVRQLLLRSSRAVVPPVWPFEVANGFVTAERRGMLTPLDTVELLQQLDVVMQSIEISHESLSMRRILNTARQSRLTAYDAAYLDLAREKDLPIATLDRHLEEAARHADVPLVRDR